MDANSHLSKWPNFTTLGTMANSLVTVAEHGGATELVGIYE